MLQDFLKKTFSKEMTEEEYYYHCAKDISSRLSNPGARKKCYVDMMGIFAILNYLKEQGFECKTERSLHKSPSILEEFEITDVYYNNYRIDVITNFGTNITKIPKCQADYDIMPDFYIVIKMAQNLSDFRILGYVKPEDVIMAYHDEKYYYPDKRYPIKDLFNIIADQRKRLPDLIDKHANCEAMFLRFLEREIPYTNKKAFIQHITTCESCTKSYQFFERYHMGMKNIEQYPIICQTLHDKILSFNPVLYKKIRGERNKKGIMSKIAQGVYGFSDNAIDFISNLSWDEERHTGYHRNMTTEQEVEYIFDKKPVFNIEAFSKLFKKRKVAFLVSAISIFLVGVIVGLLFIGTRNDKIKFDDTNMMSNEDMNYQDIGYEDYSDNGESYSYEGYEMNPVEYSGDNAANEPNGIIKNISWEVPSEVSKNREYLGFLQAVGKNIKLRLENDLILSKDIPTNKNIKVDVQFSEKSSVVGIKIVKGSGSGSVDDMIQRNIFQAFTYMKAPGAGKEVMTLTLDINL